MLPSSVRTALDLQKALSMAPFRLQQIGDCKTREHLFKKKYTYVDSDDSYDSSDEDERPSTPPKRVSDPNKPYVRELCEIYKEHGSDSWNDTMDAPFRLTVTRPGCEFSGDIIPKSEEEDEEAIAERLMKWYEHGAISGFGDVRTQETKVDKDIRDAREIPASEFTVSDGLVQEIKKQWGEHFIPSAVRVEPYKIHIYGPGGLFEFHRDTPERDLVGTFLVGLGDNCEGGLLIIGHDDYYDPYSYGVKANPGSWAAFYPDVVHCVNKIEKGHRAVIAFKVYRTGDAAAERIGFQASPEALPQQKMGDVLSKMQLPFGVLLAHKYCIGTVELNGLDNMLHAAAEVIAMRRNAKVHFLPILTKLKGTAYLTDDRRNDSISATAPVYPLTQAHVDALLARIAEDTETSGAFAEFSDDRAYLKAHQDSAYDAIIPEPEQDVIEVPNAEEWLTGLSGVPFYSVDFTRSTVVWKKGGESGAEYTGNEAKPWTEDSIYLSYAMVVLSNDPAPKDLNRKRDEE
ncbi:hypothetical protein BKA93DRAFT_750883 [Sparassis latifolia]